MTTSDKFVASLLKPIPPEIENLLTQPYVYIPFAIISVIIIIAIISKITTN